jgi:hypothetical protein
MGDIPAYFIICKFIVRNIFNVLQNGSLPTDRDEMGLIGMEWGVYAGRKHSRDIIRRVALPFGEKAQSPEGNSDGSF